MTPQGSQASPCARRVIGSVTVSATVRLFPAPGTPGEGGGFGSRDASPLPNPPPEYPGREEEASPKVSRTPGDPPL